MKVFVLASHWDIDCNESEVNGVYLTLEEAQKAMNNKYEEDLTDPLLNIDIGDGWAEDIEEKRRCVYEEFDYRYIEYKIYEFNI